MGEKEITVTEALAKLIPPKKEGTPKKEVTSEGTIEKNLQKYNKKLKEKKLILLDKHDRDDQAFAVRLREFFLERRRYNKEINKYDGKINKYGCNYAGITGFVFVQKEVTPSPQGILMYLLENIIKKLPKEDRPSDGMPESDPED